MPAVFSVVFVIIYHLQLVTIMNMVPDVIQYS